MKLAYQVSTPEVRPSPAVTAYQGDIAASFRRLGEVGYDGAELMVANPALIDAAPIERLAAEYGLDVPMVCTGEVFGQDKVSFSDPDDAVRNEAISRARAAIDLASRFGAQINLGRIRGGIVPGVPPEQSRRRAVDAFRELAEYAQSKNVVIALEPVNSLAINFINTTLEGVNMVREVGRDSFRMMLDSNHMFIDDPDMDAAIESARGVVSYVHLVDSNRKYPGNCKLDFAGFLSGLRGIGYDGYVSVEVFQIPDQDTALQKSHDHIRPLLAALR